jgi:curved DNA-binding protein CbpA
VCYIRYVLYAAAPPLRESFFIRKEYMDYYKVLEINKGATSDEIKKAYRKLALKWHPDKNKSPDAAKKFREIAQAYQILSNSDTRKNYDQGSPTVDYTFIDPMDLFMELNNFFNMISQVLDTTDAFMSEIVIISSNNMPMTKSVPKQLTKSTNTKWLTKTYPDGTIKKVMRDQHLKQLVATSHP